MIEQLLRTERARLQGEIDLIDRMLAQIPRDNAETVEERVSAIMKDPARKSEASKRRADLLECAAEIGRIFEVKELRRAYESKAGKSDKNTSFVQNSIVAFCGSGVLKKVTGMSPSTYGLREWFDISGKLKNEYK